MVGAIVADMRNRNSLQDVWENIDADTQEEIKDCWANILLTIKEER
jgi:hypothetical protein